MRAGKASAPIDSRWARDARMACSCAVWSQATRPVWASMRRTPAAMEVSATMRNGPMSPLRETWVPPQSSREMPSVSTTRTVSPYFSSKTAMMPEPGTSLRAIS